MLTAKPYHWHCLLAAITLEVGGTLIMKLAQGWAFPHAQLLGLIAMWLAIGLSYIFLSRAVTGIPVGVTFAFWEGLGLTCITLGSVLFLNEALTLRRALGLACVLSGALLVNYGTGHGTPKPSREDSPTASNKAEARKQRAEAPTLNNGLAAGGNR